MRSGVFAVALALAIGWWGALKAQEAVSPVPGIEATIDAQIEAFLRDDFAKAFTFASPNIQGIFGTHQNFGQMVRSGYPMVWRPADVQYLELREFQGALWQRVMIRDMAGGVHMLDYQMIQMGDDWRINGVQLLRMPATGA